MATPRDKRHLPHHTLYHYPTCPFCARVRFALWRYGLTLALRNILSNAEHARELTDGGGYRQVPCLRIDKDDGESEWLYESGDIVAYLRRAAAARPLESDLPHRRRGSGRP